MHSWQEGINWVGTCAQATRMAARLRILSSKADSNNWESFTRSELKLESVHQESPRSDIFRKRATKPLLKQKHRQKHLTYWLLLSGPKSSFQMKVNLQFNLEIKVPKAEGRVERHRIHVALSPVWRFQSVMIWAAMSSAGVVPLCFLKSKVNAAIYQDIFEHFMLPSAVKLYGDADFLLQQDLAPAHTAKGTKSLFNDHGVTVLDWAANSPDLNLIENLWGFVKRKMRHQTQQSRCYQRNLGFHYTRAVPQTDCLHATPHWCSNSCKSPKHWVHRNKHTFQKPDISV